MKTDEFLTIESEQTAEIKIKASRFIAETFLIESAETANTKLQTVRKREHSATHHCFAWIAGLANSQTFKYSDDGEPNGTAGKPIYDQIIGKNLTNTLLVVTRYYGGTKLGTGGLSRAYSEAVALALGKSSVKQHFLTTKFETRCEFSYYDRWLRVLQQLGAEVINSDFAEKVTLTIKIRQTLAEQLKTKYIELTSGQGEIKIV